MSIDFAGIAAGRRRAHGSPPIFAIIYKHTFSNAEIQNFLNSVSTLTHWTGIGKRVEKVVLISL